MKHLLSALLCTVALASADAWAANTTNCCTVAPYLSMRSQSEDAARELAGWTEHVNLNKKGKMYSSSSLTPVYTRSFRATDLASLLFGCDLQGCDCRSLYIRGMNLADRNNQKDLASAYFYLPNDFKGNVCFNPLVQNILVDFNMYLGLDEWVDNLYFRIHAPITHTKWALQPFQDEVLSSTATLVNYNSSFLTTGLNSFYDYACQGKAPAPQSITIDGTPTPIYFQGLHYAKICPCAQKRTGLSDIQADFGWNFTRERYHIGAFARVAMPTGNRPQGEYLFEPIIGNGKQWEFGGGITSHAVLYNWDDQNRTVNFFCDANITHLFSARQRRVFDLCNNGPLSRYMLAAKVTEVNDVPTLIEVQPVANLTRCTVNVSSAVQVDVVALLNYFHNNFTLDFGYDFWLRSCEKIKCASCDCCNSSCQELDGKTWQTFKNGTIHELPSLASIIDSENVYALAQSALNTNGARTRGVSHKLFTHFSYNFFDYFDRAIPFLGFGVEVEFGAHEKLSKPCCCGDETPACCIACTKQCCRSCALSQWGIWAKGGLSF